jgi:hypothetical protein
MENKELNILDKTITIKKLWDARFLIMGIFTAVFSFIKFQADNKIDRLNLKNEFEMRCIKLEQNQIRANDKIDQIDSKLGDLKNRFEYLERSKK